MDRRYNLCRDGSKGHSGVRLYIDRCKELAKELGHNFGDGNNVCRVCGSEIYYLGVSEIYVWARNSGGAMGPNIECREIVIRDIIE